jgi:hypothetical protein
MDYNQIVAAIHQKDLQQINFFLKHEMKEDLPWGDIKNKFWFDLFSIFEKYVRTKLGRRPTAKQLSKQMPFLAQFTNAGNINLDELINRPKYAIAALLSRGEQSSIDVEAWARGICRRRDVRKDKKASLLSFLLENKILARNPFTLADMRSLVYHRSNSLLNIVIKR